MSQFTASECEVRFKLPVPRPFLPKFTSLSFHYAAMQCNNDSERRTPFQNDGRTTDRRDGWRGLLYSSDESSKMYVKASPHWAEKCDVVRAEECPLDRVD